MDSKEKFINSQSIFIIGIVIVLLIFLIAVIIIFSQFFSNNYKIDSKADKSKNIFLDKNISIIKENYPGLIDYNFKIL
jgi:Na+-transporting methylmalonyl-CoA/oxaloacetate decarboxylase gamma subunit